MPIDPRRLGTLALYLRSDKGVIRASGTNVQDWVDQSGKPRTFENASYENKFGTNLGFESALGAEWVETITATGTTARDATVSKYGTASLKLVMTNSTASGEVVERAQTFADIDAAEVWSYQIWIRIDELTNCKVVLLVDYTDGTPDVSAETTTVDGTQFVKLTLSNETAPASTTAAVVRIRLESTAASGTGTVYVDGVMVVQAASLPNIYSQGNSIKNSFEQRTTASQPTVTSAVFRGKLGVRFDGQNDHLLSVLGAYLTGSSGLAIGLLRIVATVDTRVRLFTSERESEDTGHRLTTRYDNNNPNLTIQERRAGVAENTVKGDTTVAASNRLVAVWRSNGSAWFIRRNGRGETITAILGSNVGRWWSGVTSRVNTVLGAGKTTVVDFPYNGHVALFLVYEGDPGMGARMKQLERMIRQRGLRALR